MRRFLLLFALLSACASTQKAHSFTARLAKGQARCRAETMLRTGPWLVETDAQSGRIHAKPLGTTLGALLGIEGTPKDGAPATWAAKTEGASFAAPRSQRVERNIVVTLDEAQTGSTRVGVSIEDVACIDDASSFRGACSVSYPSSDEVNRTIHTIGRALALWLSKAGPSCYAPS